MNSKLLFFYLTFTSLLFAQDYSTQWEEHYSYLSITGISNSQDEIIASAENTIFKHNTSTHNNNNTSTINGLSGEQISSFYYSEQFNVSVIGYENGLLEIVNDENEVTTVVDILNKPTIAPDAKKINHIYEHNDLIYLSCDFGISTYDLDRLEFADTYYIGNGGGQISVKQTTVKDDYIYAATASNGIKRALHADPNIINFALWTTVSPGSLTDWESIVTFNNTLYAINSNKTVYEYDLVSFNSLFSYPTIPLDHRTNQDKMIVTTTNKSYIYDSPFILNREIDFLPEYGSNFTTATVVNNNIYIGTENDGLLNFNLSDGVLTESIKPNGPTENNQFSVRASNNEVWVVYGDHTISYNPSPLDSKGYSYLKNNSWTNTPYENVFDAKSLVDIAINPFDKNQVFISSYNDGLLEINNGTPTVLYNENNSDLQSLGPFLGNPNFVSLRIGKSMFDNNGKLWLTNNLVDKPLKAYDPQNNSWESYNLLPVVTSPLGVEIGFGDLIVDKNNNKWIGAYNKGVIGFSKNSGGTIVKNIDLDNGNLPSNVITGLAIDKDNNLWIGTLQGLRVLYNTSGFFTNPNPQAQEIIILDNGIPKELMFGQFITDIEVDGSNNKWISTFDSGVFYLSSDGQETIYHFTTDNSPLPSDNITDMAIDDTTGKVYFATPKGLVAFKGLSKESSNNLENVIVYPNPVRPHQIKNLLGFDASNISKGIKIEGLTEKVNIKITDISGNLVADANTGTQSGNLYIEEGNYAIWNGKNFNNNIVASGVYVIMITDLDSSETTIEKVMIVK